MSRVVITGYGAVSPVGYSAKENWEAILSGKSGIDTIKQFDAAPYTSQIAGEVKDYVPTDHFSVKELKKMDRFIQFNLIAAKEAMSHSGLNPSEGDQERMGCIMGVGIGGLIEIQNQYNVLKEKGPRRVTPFFIPAIIPNLAAGQVAIKYGLKGPNTAIVTACSSSAHAIGESARLIQRGDVDVMVTGGAEAVICDLGFAGFCSARALSTRNDDPNTASRPFDKGRDGFVMGEGSAVIVLESYEHAKARGATILAEVAGYGLNCDANHITQPAPEGEGGARCMKLALKDAKIDPSKIDYINAHGTSTPIGDILETKAIKAVFSEHAKELTVSSTKSMTGHLLGAAGAIEALYCVQAIENQTIPPTINISNPDPDCDLDYCPNEPKTKKLNYVMSNSFGFGGTNATLILKQAEA